MDYAFLRREGIRHLERLAGQVWSDFNAHDPGITILEQLCYALTDLAYRINYPLPDLLTRTGKPTYDSLYSPAQILTSRPVTLDDLRKLVIDVAGVKNGWVEPLEAPEPPLYFYADQNTLSLQNGSLAAEPVYLKGLYRVLVELTDDTSIQSGTVWQEIVRRLHAQRSLAEDFAEVRLLEPQWIQVNARIELAAAEEAEAILLEIYRRIAAYISPPVQFYTLNQLLESGKPVDEIFEGPRLEHGFILTDELRQAQRRPTLRASDLIREIMATPGVRAVRRISLSAGGPPQAWLLNLEPARAAKLDLPASNLSLERNGLEVRVDRAKVINLYYQQMRSAAAAHKDRPDEQDLPLPQGRDRRVESYYSLQHQFPATYGIGALGLPESASPQRQAQAKQLKAYLLFFDQLLANYLAQLAHVGDLFSFTASQVTYFSQPITDPTLGLDDIYRLQDPAAHQQRLQELTENPSTAPETHISRRQRFLNHLLARFAEQFTDYSLLLYEAQGQTDPTAKLIQARQAFLQEYPQLSAARGSAFNYLLPRSNDNSSGLEKRLRHKLGLSQPEEEFYLVEHILLRPMAEDQSQQVPILAVPRLKDPYSLQLSFVFPNWPERFKQPDFQAFVERTIREETPAHLAVRLHWLDLEAMAAFKDAYQDWLDKRRAYWAEKFGG